MSGKRSLATPDAERLMGDCEKRKPRLGKRGLLSVGLVRSVGRRDLKHYVEAGPGRVQKILVSRLK